MTQEQKDILLKDLCARLPYDVKVNCYDKVYNFNGIQYFNICTLTDDNENNAFTTTGIKYIKPYLFPISSMTEEQKEEFNTQSLKLQLQVIDEEIMYEKATEFEVDFYNKHNLDWRGLIPMGLAIDATGLNIY